MLNRQDRRAIKIVELMEELDVAKKIIADFVWPPDATEDQRTRSLQKAANFAGCTVPVREATKEDFQRLVEAQQGEV